MINKFIILLLTLAPSFAFANYTGPLLQFSTGGGIAPVGQWSFKVCDVFADKIVVTVQTQNAKVTHEKSAATSGISKLIEAASKGPIENMPPAPANGPSTAYIAYEAHADDTATRIDLFVYATGRGKAAKNHSPAAIELETLIDQLCK